MKKLILSANKKDISNAKYKKINNNMLERLKLSTKKNISNQKFNRSNYKICRSGRENFIFLETTKWSHYQKSFQYQLEL